MSPLTPSRRLAAATALVAGPLLAGASMVTQPDLSGSSAHQLAVIGASALAPLSAALFVVSQLALLLAVMAIGWLLVPAAPRLSGWGTALGVLGAFGHTVYGGLMLAVVQMAADPAHRTVYAALMDRIQASPVMIFSVLGLAGTVLGLVVLGVGLLRSGTGPRWVGPALWAFVVVEFAGGAISSSASYLSTVLLLVAFVPLARLVAQPATQVGSEQVGSPALLVAR